MDARTETAGADTQRLRLGLRLLRVVRIVEGELRERLKREFDSTLPRFDVLSALHRRPEGMLMSDLSRVLLVSNGNVTVIVDRLVADGFIVKAAREGDRRTSMARLTPRGAARFAAMAEAHRAWIDELLEGIGEVEAESLSTMLKAFRSNWESEH